MSCIHSQKRRLSQQHGRRVFAERPVWGNGAFNDLAQDNSAAPVPHMMPAQGSADRMRGKAARALVRRAVMKSCGLFRQRYASESPEQKVDVAAHCAKRRGARSKVTETPMACKRVNKERRDLKTNVQSHMWASRIPIHDL